MKDNKMINERDPEKELKEKMAELSSNVDCFDKISARAFPEKDPDFYDSELTECNLENVTGKRKTLPVLKWVAVAAAVVICVGVLPKTLVFQNFFSNLGKQTDSEYRNIISEIKVETNKHTYKIYDMPLEDYIAYDFLIDPVFSCPFEAEEVDGINVRVFVRMYNDYPTNQVYAVEYSGDYSESNILAAAESKEKFTDDDFKQLDDNIKFGTDNEAYAAASDLFTNDKYCMLVDKNQNRVTAASFTYDHIFKHENTVKALQTQVLYYNSPENNDIYYYDTLTTATAAYSDNLEYTIEYKIPDGNKLWKTSINYDGSDAMPKNNSSVFIKKELFAYTAKGDNDYGLSWYEPYNIADEQLADDKIQTLLFSLHEDKIEFKTPADSEAKHTMRIYEPYITHFSYDSRSDPTIDISVEGKSDQIIVHNSDIKGGLSSDQNIGVQGTTSITFGF